GGEEGLAVSFGAQDDDGGVFETGGRLLGERAQFVGCGAGDRLGDDPSGPGWPGGGREVGGLFAQLGGPEPGEFGLCGGEGGQALAEGAGCVGGTGAEQAGEFVDQAPFG